MKSCVTFDVEGLKEEEQFILDIANFKNIEDFFYMYYGERIKFCLVGVTRENTQKFLDDAKAKEIVSLFSFVDSECELDISKILACSTRKMA